MNSVYAQRRARLAAQLGAGGIAIIPTAPERGRNRDNGYLYRHDSYFHYLTGFTEPNAVLVLAADGRSTLFCQPKDLEREIWDGYRLGPEAAIATLVVAAVAVPVVAGVTWLLVKYPPPLSVRLLQWMVCGLLMVAGLSMLRA